MRLIVPLILLLFSVTAAASETIRIDSAHSSASFAVRTLWLQKIEGRMPGLLGTVVLGDSEQTRVDAQVDVNQVRMDNERYKSMLRSPEFFDTENHPTIRFRSSAFDTRLLFDGGNIDGELTMRGVTRAVTFELLPGSCQRDQLKACRIRVRGVIERSRFGMNAHRFTVSDHVHLRLAIRLVAQS